MGYKTAIKYGCSPTAEEEQQGLASALLWRPTTPEQSDVTGTMTADNFQWMPRRPCAIRDRSLHPSGKQTLPRAYIWWENASNQVPPIRTPGLPKHKQAAELRTCALQSRLNYPPTAKPHGNRSVTTEIDMVPSAPEESCPTPGGM